MKEKRKSCKVMALLMTALMCVSMLPAWAFAEEPAPVPGDHEHVYQHVEKIEATCQHSGMEEHYVCTVEGCEKIFDKDKKEVEDPSDLIIEILEHEWDEGVPSEENLMYSIYTCQKCGATKEEYTPTNFIPGIIVPQSKKIKNLKGYKGYTFSFKTKVTDKVQQFMDEAKLDRIWVRAGKSQMKVNWKYTSKAKFIDGMLLMRRDGSSKTFKEVAEVPFKKNKKGVLTWDPKNVGTDKTAKAKNKAYTYVVIAYYDEDTTRYISNPSDWAAGQTTASKLKTVTTAKMNKKSADLQYKGTVQLKLTYAKPKTTYNAKSFRWSSDNTKIAKVSSSGKVTATGVGKTTIRGRLSSGDEFTSKVSVVGAFKPSTPKLSVDVASNKSISLKWTKAKKANGYDVYRSDDGLHWHKPVKVKGTSYTATKLTTNHRYTFYVVARNDNHGYTAFSSNSNVVNQKAVIKRRPTTVTGFPKSATGTAGNTFSVSLKITSPDKRKASLQMLKGKKWSTMKSVTLPAGAGKKSVKIVFPNSWWSGTSSWRLVIPNSNTSEAYTSPTLRITVRRRFQNPSSMIQISNSISKHGFRHYVAPTLVNNMSTRNDCVEMLIKTAYKYNLNKFVSGASGAPGTGIDDGGLVIQSCYGAGIDLWTISPSTRNTNAAPAIMNAKLQKITNYGTPTEGNFPNVYRGDLIFFKTGKEAVGHVAIYLGLNKIIHASPVTGKVEVVKLTQVTNAKGKYKYKIAGVRRVFSF